MICLIGGVAVHAQETSFGVKAGVNLSNFGGDPDGDAKVGFNAGVTLDYGFTPEWYLLTGLEFTMKGSKYKKTIAGIETETKANPMYLQLPVHVGYKLTIVDETRIVFHAGPYVAYGIGGKSKLKVGENIGTLVDEESDFFGDDAAKRFDFGLGGGIGVEFGSFNVGIGCDFGLLNIERNDDFKVKNQNAYLTVGYKF